jgi:hypothetical protein
VTTSVDAVAKEVFAPGVVDPTQNPTRTVSVLSTEASVEESVTVA